MADEEFGLESIGAMVNHFFWRRELTSFGELLQHGASTERVTTFLFPGLVFGYGYDGFMHHGDGIWMNVPLSFAPGLFHTMLKFGISRKGAIVCS
jgi:hypothetical protein